MRHLLSLAVLVAGCASAHIGPIEVTPTGGAGFAGLRTANLIQTPAISVTPIGCTGRCAATVIIDSVDLVTNRHYEWRPALSTGVAFQHYNAEGLGGGVGLNIVLIPGVDAQTAPWPAITAHLGTHSYGFFAGLIIAPTDGIALPPGVTTLRVQRNAIPDLVTHNTGRAGNFYFGMQLGGKTP